MSLEKISRDAILYTLGDFAVVAVNGFLLLPVYTNFLTKANYGKYSAVMANVGIFTYFVFLGMPSAAARLYFSFKERGRHLEYIGNIVLFYLLSSLVLFLALSLFKEKIWGGLSPEIDVAPFMWIAFALAFLNFIPELYLLWLRLERRIGLFLTVQLSKIAIFCLLIFWLLIVRHAGLYGLFTAQVATYLLFWIIFLSLFVYRLKWRLSLTDVRQTLELAFPFFLSYIALFLNQKFSIIALQRSISYEELALFTFGLQVAMVMALVNGAVTKAIQPTIYSTPRENLPPIINSLGYKYKLVMLFVCTCIIISADLLVDVLASQEYAGSEIYISLIAVSNLIFMFAALENSVIIYFKKSKMILISVSFAAGMNVLLNILLIPFFGIAGAVFAMVISSQGAFYLSAFFCRQLLKTNFNYKTIFLYSLVCIGTVVFSMILDAELYSSLDIAKKSVSFVFLFLFFVYFFQKPVHAKIEY